MTHQHGCDSTPTDPTTMSSALAEELVAMGAADLRLAQRAMTRFAEGATDPADAEDQLAWRRVTTHNADRLNEIMDEYGWPTVALVGAEAARIAWKIAQHADRQLDVQRRALELLERAVAAGQAGDTGPRDLAFLRDRVLVNEGRKQIYGTQIAGVADGAPVPWPCADPDLVDRLRAEVGIEPFAAHTARTTP